MITSSASFRAIAVVARCSVAYGLLQAGFASTTPTLGAINDWATTDHHPEKVSVAKLGANKFITCADDTDADTGICYASTVSGTTITHGSLATIVNDDLHETTDVAYMSDDKFILTYSDETTDNTNVRAGTVSSTTIALGTVQAIDDEDAWDPRIVRHDATHALHVRADLPGTTTPQGVSNYVTASYGATSTITLGSDYTFRSPTIDAEGSYGLDAVAVGTDTFVVCYVDSGDTDDGACKAATWQLVGATTTPIGILQNVSYTYDAVGNITQITDHSETGTGKSISFGYDDLHRLTSASTTAASSTPFLQTYAYNAIGNITSKSDIGSYTYDGTGHANPHAATAIGGTSYAYDNSGNVTNAGSWGYAWDYRNRLTASTDGATTTYGYDHHDQRVLKFGATTSIYPSKYFSREGATTTAYIVLPDDTLVATVEGGGTATSTNYMHADHLGSTNVLTNASGTAVQVLDYYPYGSKRIDAGTDLAEREFIGQFFDDESDLSYLNARYYDGTRGKFLAQDPAVVMLEKSLLSDPQQLNTYSYSRNNPIRFFDPTGKLTVVVPGTNYSKSDWSEGGKASDFLSSVGKTFNETPQVAHWSGKDNHDARVAGAETVLSMIKGHTFAEGEKLNIVGHSHGGNIGILVSQMTDRKVDNLVTLGTPVRSDYQPNYDMIGAHTNVFSRFDLVQRYLGGEQGMATDALSFGSFGSLGVALTRAVHPFLEFGPAGRTYENATNVSATWLAGLPGGAHSNLWQVPSVWSKVDSEL